MRIHRSSGPLLPRPSTTAGLGCGRLPAAVAPGPDCAEPCPWPTGSNPGKGMDTQPRASALPTAAALARASATSKSLPRSAASRPGGGALAPGHAVPARRLVRAVSLTPQSRHQLQPPPVTVRCACHTNLAGCAAWAWATSAPGLGPGRRDRSLAANLPVPSTLARHLSPVPLACLAAAIADGTSPPSTSTGTGTLQRVRAMRARWTAGKASKQRAHRYAVPSRTSECFSTLKEAMALASLGQTVLASAGHCCVQPLAAPHLLQRATHLWQPLTAGPGTPASGTSMCTPGASAAVRSAGGGFQRRMRSALGILILVKSAMRTMRLRLANLRLPWMPASRSSSTALCTATKTFWTSLRSFN